MLIALVSIDSVSLKRGCWRFFLFSFGMYGVGASWVYVSIHEHGNASPILAGFLVILFVSGLSLLSLIHGYLYLRFLKSLSFGLLLGFPLAWLLREWSFTWLLTGFPWLFAGYGYLATPLAHYVPIIGVLGLGLLVMLQGSALAWFAIAPDRQRGLVLVAAMVLIWGGGLTAGQFRFVSAEGEPVQVAAVQGNVDQHLKWRPESAGRIIDTYLSLTNEVWSSDLIVWPEASITLFREDAVPLLEALGSRARRSGAALILGLPDRSPEGRFWNTAIAIGEGEGQYIKRRLVPFGEYVPLESRLRGLVAFFDLPMSRNRSGPDEQIPLTAVGLGVSVSICYEVVYPALVRLGELPVDLLVTISNDTWFGNSIGPYQHLEMARARALENGRYLVRATNDGITAIVDDQGHVIDRLPRFAPGVLRGEVFRMRGMTPYAAWGDAPMLTLAIFVLLVLVVHRWHVSRSVIG